MRCSVIADTVNTVINLSDGVLVSTSLLECDVSEYCERCTLCCGSRLDTVSCAFWHRCSVNGRKVECELCSLAPVIECLSSSQVNWFGLAVSVVDCKAWTTIICCSCSQLVVLVLSYCYDYLMWSCVVSNVILAAVLLCDRVLIGACLVICNTSEYCYRSILSSCDSHLAVLSSYRHWCILYRFKDKVECVIVCPCCSCKALGCLKNYSL